MDTKLKEEIDEAALEFWINYNYVGKGIEEFEEWLDDEEYNSQYREVCQDPDCDRVLDKDCPIMCYDDLEGGDMTLCHECYFDCKYYMTDKNEDNEEIIEEWLDDDS